MTFRRTHSFSRIVILSAAKDRLFSFELRPSCCAPDDADCRFRIVGLMEQIASCASIMRN